MFKATIRNPYAQGHLDGTCGIYAIINSLVYLYGYSEKACEKLLLPALCAPIAEQFPKALWQGLGVPQMQRMLHAAESFVHKRNPRQVLAWRMPFWRKSFSHAEQFWDGAQELLTDEGRILIVGLNEPWDHWTPVRKVSRSAVAFFDSYGIKHFSRRRFILAGEADAAQRIKVDYHQTFLLARDV